MDKDTQLALAAGLRAGDRQAWSQLYDAYAQRVWTAIARLMGFDCAAVADVVQETFLAAARSAKGFDPARGSLWAWLWGIARRQMALHYRKHGPTSKPAHTQSWSTLLETSHDWIDGKSDPPEDILQTRELAALVRLALRELPGKYQTLLVAKHVDGRPVQAMAAELNCSPSAVSSKLARARKAFRKAFRQAHTTMRSMPDTTEVSS
jgi:RNA polymerase sigma-70 factor (ECF subfamily)